MQGLLTGESAKGNLVAKILLAHKILNRLPEKLQIGCIAQDCVLPASPFILYTTLLPADACVIASCVSLTRPSRMILASVVQPALIRFSNPLAAPNTWQA